jgi:hypothetical protein
MPFDLALMSFRVPLAGLPAVSVGAISESPDDVIWLEIARPLIVAISESPNDLIWLEIAG